MLKAIIFDCFGVLYPQASGNFYKSHEKLFQSHLEVLDGLNLEIDMGEISRKEFFAGLKKVTGIPAKVIQHELDSQLILDQKLASLIKKLKTRYKIGLFSNAGEEEIEIIYRDKIDGLFDAMTVSYELKSVKPNPQIFITCLAGEERLERRRYLSYEFMPNLFSEFVSPPV